MAATGPDSTNTSEFPSFSVLKDSERRAVILKGEGKSIAQITAHINEQFVLELSERTVQEWFVAGGRLEQAYAEFQEAKAHTSLQEARQLIKIASKAAAANMIAKINSQDDRVSLDASRHLLNKYIPDRQVISDSPEPEADLPDELKEAAAALREAEDGPDKVDDSPVGGQDPEAPGA